MQGGLLIAFPKQEGYTHRPAFALVGDFLPHVAPIRQLADRSYVGLYILTNNSICILPALEYNYSDNLNQYTLLIRLNSERGWNSDLYKGNMSTFNTIATIILTVFFVSGCVYFGTNHCANPKCGSWRTYLDDFIINDKKNDSMEKHFQLRICSQCGEEEIVSIRHVPKRSNCSQIRGCTHSS